MANPRNLANIAPLFAKSSSDTVDYSGTNLKFSGTAQRFLIKTDGTQADRFAFQTTATNGNTRLWIYPSGTGNITGVAGHTSASDFTNYNAFDLAVLGGASQEVRLTSIAAGTATAYPITFRIGGSEQMRLSTTGLGIGASPSYKLDVYTGVSGVVQRWNTGSVSMLAEADHLENGNWFLSPQGTSTFNVKTGGSTRFTLDATGNIFVGSTQTTTSLGLASTRRYLVMSSPDSNQIGVLSFCGQTGGLSNNGNIEWYDPGNTASSSLRNAFIFSGTIGSVANNKGSFIGFGIKEDGVSGSGGTAMRLTSLGLGIGTDAVNRLDVFGSGSYSAAVDMTNAQLRLKHTIFPVQLYAGLDHVNRFAYMQASETGIGYRNLILQPAGGNLGVGTTVPTGFGTGYQTIAVNGTNGSVAEFQVAAAIYGTITADSANFRMVTPGANPISFYTDAQQRITITSTGNLGIGLTNPGAKLEIYGSGNLVRLGDGTNTHDLRFQGPNNWDLQLNTTTDIFSVRRNSVSYFSVTSDGIAETRKISLTDANGFSRYALSYSNWGYSSAYKTLVIGSASTSYNVNVTGAITVSFNYDPSANTNSAFSGDGREILFRRGTRFVTPNAADNAFNLYNLVLLDGNVGIGTDNPINRLEVKGVFAAPLASGNAQNGIARFSQATGPGSLDIGFGDPYSWLQSRSSDNYATNYSLSLNPNGGNVGIGTIDPTARLNIYGVGVANNPGLALDITTSTSFIHAQENFAANITSGQTVLNVVGREGSTKNSAYIGYLYSGTSGSNNNKLTFGHWANDHLMVIDGLGNVGIGLGTTNPTARLHIKSSGAQGLLLDPDTSDTNNSSRLFLSNSSHSWCILNNSGNLSIRSGATVGADSGTQRAYFDTSGNFNISGTLTESSSITIKENINPIINALESIISMNGYVYDRKDGTAKQRAGLIAEEVNNVLPNVVAKDDAGNPTGIQYTNLIAYLVESIKTLHKRIESLEK